MQDRAGAQWAPDPFGRHELRYWDGSQWSEHVSDQGRTSTDTPLPAQRPREAATPAPGTTHHPVIRLDGPVVGAAGAAVRREVHDDVDALVVGRTRTRTQARPLVVDLTAAEAAPQVAGVAHRFDPAPVGYDPSPVPRVSPVEPSPGYPAVGADRPSLDLRAYEQQVAGFDGASVPGYGAVPAAPSQPTSRRQALAGVAAMDAMLQADADDDVVAHLAAGPSPVSRAAGPTGAPVDEISLFAPAARPDALPDGAPMTRAQARAAAVPQQHHGDHRADHRADRLDADGPEVWDWRESKLPEILSGAAVAFLIALAAFFGGGFGGGDASPASQTVGTKPEVAVPSIAGAQAPTRTTAPKAKISKATGRRTTTYRSNRPTTRRTTVNRTTTTPAPAPTSPSEPAPSDSTSTTDPAPSDSSSSSDPNPQPSDSQSSTSPTKPTPKATTSTSPAK